MVPSDDELEIGVNVSQLPNRRAELAEFGLFGQVAAVDCHIDVFAGQSRAQRSAVGVRWDEHPGRESGDHAAWFVRESDKIPTE